MERQTDISGGEDSMSRKMVSIVPLTGLVFRWSTSIRVGKLSALNSSSAKRPEIWA